MIFCKTSLAALMSALCLSGVAQAAEKVEVNLSRDLATLAPAGIQSRDINQLVGLDSGGQFKVVRSVELPNGNVELI